MRIKEIGNLRVQFGAVFRHVNPTGWFVIYPMVRFGAVSKKQNPTVRFGALTHPTVRFGAVFRNQESRGAVRRGFQIYIYMASAARCCDTSHGAVQRSSS